MPALLLLLVAAAPSPTPAQVRAALDVVKPVYLQLHQAPELAGQEEKTAALLLEKLKALNVPVTGRVGGHGLVAVLQNGPGRTVWLRTDLDGLPLLEKTGVPFASKATGLTAAGQQVPTMHACGHDVHMASWLGAALLLITLKDSWRGTVVLLAQPAEETGAGAKAMLKDGVLERFPRPEVALALHSHAQLPAGAVGVVAGPVFANVDSLDVTFFGRGGHGAYPHLAVDPVLMAARFVDQVQSLVSREQSPFEPAVVTVGSFHGGTTHNIIPDEVKLQLTARSYTAQTRQALRDGLARLAKAQADAARAPKAPLVMVEPGPTAVVNDAATMARLSKALEAALGAEQVRAVERAMAGEDFGEYGRAGGFPSALVWLGTVEPRRFADAQKRGEALPSLHSPLFVPDVDRTLETGVRALTVMALEVLAAPPR